MALQNCKASSNNDFVNKLINKVQHSMFIIPIITCQNPMLETFKACDLEGLGIKIEVGQENIPSLKHIFASVKEWKELNFKSLGMDFHF